MFHYCPYRIYFTKLCTQIKLLFYENQATKYKNRILQPVSCYFPALLIETMFLNAFFQNGMYQFLQLHTVHLADYNQLCKGIFLYG